MTAVEYLLVSSGNGPGECRMAVGHLVEEIESDGAVRGLDVDVSARDAAHGPSSAVLVLRGKGADVMASDWEGVVLWRCASPIRPKHKRKNWFVQVFRLPPPAQAARIDPDSVSMQAIRAGGPGGQHQNKTSSAIRATWTGPGGQVYSVVVRSDRSQHRNRSLAISRLEALVASDLAASEAARAGQAHGLHQALERGAPARIYHGEKFLAEGG